MSTDGLTTEDLIAKYEHLPSSSSHDIFELSIDVGLVSEWGVWAGLREMAQNALDSETEYKAPFSWDYDAEACVLTLENKGAILDKAAMLMGRSSKRGKSAMIGQYGQGLKEGTLALLRAGYEVTIRTNGETWTGCVVQSEKFESPVLAYAVEKTRKVQKVSVAIHGVTPENMEELRERVLRMVDGRAKKNIVETRSGDLLLGDRFKGRIYVKGIFVEHDPDLKYGYNLRDARLDRDRKMIIRWDRAWKLRQVWESAVEVRPDLMNPLYKMLERDDKEVEDFADTDFADPDVVEQVVARFQEKHGNKVPVENMSQSKDLGHLGAKGVMVRSKSLFKLLTSTLGTFDQQKSKLSNEIVKMYMWDELSTAERKSIEEAIEIVNWVTEVSLDSIDVADFRSEGTMGQYRDRRIVLRKSDLEDRHVTLETLIHEVAHRNTEGKEDGDHAHVSEIERIWAGIVRAVRS